MSRGFHAHSQATCDRARRLCQVHRQKVVAELLGMTPASLSRIKKRGFQAGRARPRRPVPPDFAVQANALTVRELVRLYRTSDAIIARWRRAIGEQSRRGHARGSFTPLPRPTRAALETAIARGRSFEGIAAEFGVSRPTLREWRRHYGIAHLAPGQRVVIGWAERYIADRKAA